MNPAAWAQALLRALGVPVTAGGTAILVAWQACEGGVAAQQGFNPLNTTEPAPGSRPLPGNPAGVQLYPSAPVGVAATAATLTNGRYPTILAALRTGQPARLATAAGVAEIATWGTDPACLLGRLGLRAPRPGGGPAWGPLVAIVVGVPLVWALRRR